MLRRLCYLVPLLLSGCAPAAWQPALETAGTIVDTAAVVRAKQLGLCGAGPTRPLVSVDDVLAMQAEIEALTGDLAAAQGQLTRLAVERARAPLPAYSLPPLPPPPPKPASTLPPLPAMPPPPAP